MKQEVRIGLYWSIFSICLAFIVSLLLVYVVKGFENVLYWFSYMVFMFGIFHLLAWALVKFKDGSQIMNKKYFYEKDEKIKERLREEQLSRRHMFLYSALFNMICYTALYIISLI